MHFQSNYLIFWFKTFYRGVDFEIIWTKYGKDNNGQSWVLLYGTKDDVKKCCIFIPYSLSTS
jgi:hypothetical protein